jgi:pimeloyl-ACP methyl ester carboxylesterase
MAVQSKTAVLASGLALDYVEQGDPSGLPLLLLHGYTDSWRSFQPLLAALPQRLRVIALSQRGHGDSDKPRGRYGASVLAADLADFMDRLGIEAAVIAGHSMGSQVAQRFAIDHPQRTRALVLLGAFTTLKGHPDVEALWDQAVAGLDDPVAPGFVREFQQSTLSRPVPAAFFEAIVAESLKVPAHVWRSALRGQLDEDVSRELAAISAPTLVLWGDKDGIAVRSQQESIAAAIPGARLIVYAGAGHGHHWEEPRKAAIDIAAFLDGIAAPTPDARRIASTPTEPKTGRRMR